MGMQEVQHIYSHSSNFVERRLAKMMLSRLILFRDMGYLHKTYSSKPDTAA